MKYGLFRGYCDKRDDSCKMTNSRVPSPPRSQSAVTDSIEDAIEKIQRLRVTADDEDVARSDRTDLPIDELEDDEENERERKRDDAENSDDEERSEEEEKSDEEDDLVERGPMKQYSSSTRARPYHASTERRCFVDLHESVLLDYDKSVEEILRDEKLLDAANEINRNRFVGEKDQTVSQENELISLSVNDVDDTTGSRLLDDVLRGVFQAGQTASSKVDDDACRFWDDHESSYLAESPAWTTRTVSDCSVDACAPGPDSRIVPSIYREPLSSFHSYSSSSCSSNQSFGDAASPKSYQMPPVEERRIEEPELNDCTFWRKQELESVENRAISAILKELVNGLETETGIRTEETRGCDFNDVVGVEPVGESTNLPSFAEMKRFNPVAGDFPSCLSEISYADLVPVLDSLANSSPVHSDRSKNLEKVETVESTGAIDDSRIPKVLASFESRPPQHLNKSKTNASLWTSLNMPSVPASDVLKEQLDPMEVRNAMINLLKWRVEELAGQDRDGDTALMCLVGNVDEFLRKKAYLVPLVERLNTIKGAIAITNRRGEDALYLAAMNIPQFPYVAGYLAAVMLQKNIDIGQQLYRISGDTLIHAVAAQGDSHAEVLAELLSLKTSQGHPVFDPSKRNYDGKTALHVAVESHNPFYGGTWSLTGTKLLLKYGADSTTKETRRGDTPLHVAVSRACDPALVKVLLEARGLESLNSINYDHDTPLHAAVATTNVPLSRQAEICWLLIRSGANTNLLNLRGEIPLDLASSDRRDSLAKIFYAVP